MSSRPAEAPSSAAFDVPALTRAMVKGDEMAYRAFHDAYFDRLLRYLLVVTGGNEEAARETLQLTFIRVARHIKPFDAEEKFWSWLTVLARSAFLDETRKRRRYFSFLERFTWQSQVDSRFGDNGQADERLRGLLESKLASLPAEEQALIEQKYLSRRGVREIAAGLRTTEKAVESRLSRIRQKLKGAVLAALKDESS